MHLANVMKKLNVFAEVLTTLFNLFPNKHIKAYKDWALPSTALNLFYNTMLVPRLQGVFTHNEIQPDIFI